MKTSRTTVLLILIGSLAAWAATGRLAVTKTRYRISAGQIATVELTDESRRFAANAPKISSETTPHGFSGISVGIDQESHQPVLAVPLTMPAGSYSVTFVVTDSNSQDQTATVEVTVEPMPALASSPRPPVLLMNGWQAPKLDTCPLSKTSEYTFGSLESYLTQDGAPVVFFDNCKECRNCTIEDLGNRLNQLLSMLRYTDGTPVSQVDIVAHSMGGLIARAYLAGLQNDGALLPPANQRIRKLVLVATPNFGSFLASDLGPQTHEMIPGSAFLWNLATWNQRGDDLRGVDALAIIGDAGLWNGLQNASDGVVSLTSASLGFARDPSRTRILPYYHIDPGFFLLS